MITGCPSSCKATADLDRAWSGLAALGCPPRQDGAAGRDAPGLGQEMVGRVPKRRPWPASGRRNCGAWPGASVRPTAICGRRWGALSPA
jgi:hypothetical protein